MANNGYLIDGFWIGIDAVRSVEYMKFRPAAAGVAAAWVTCKTIDEFRVTPENLRAIKINDGAESKVIERPADIFLIDLHVLMNAKTYVSPAGKLEASTGVPPIGIPAAIVPPAAKAPEKPIIPGMTNP